MESEHADSLRALGAKRVNNMIFWRSKRGVRKISPILIKEISKGFESLKSVKKDVNEFLRRVLKLCLVKVAADAN